MKQNRTLCRVCATASWSPLIRSIVFYPGRKGFKPVEVETRGELRICEQCFPEREQRALKIIKAFERKTLPKGFLWKHARVTFKDGAPVEVERYIPDE